MALGITLKPASVPDDSAVTYGLLRDIASPTVAVTGEAGTSQIGDYQVTAVKGAIGAWHKCSASGTNTITLTPANGQTVSALADGMVVAFPVAVTNTAAVTLQFNAGATTAKDLRKHGDGVLAAGDLKAGEYIEARYNSSSDVWQVVSPVQTNAPSWAEDSSMSANTLTAAPQPPWDTYTTGRSIEVKVANTNTGAVTLAVSGLTAKDCKKNGTAALGAGDLLEGMVYRFTYDGTNFQLVSPSFTSAQTWTRDVSRGLILALNGTNPNYQLDVNADELMLATGGGVPLRLTSVDLTLDISLGNTLLSRENGTTESSSTWYYVWVISDGTNTSAVFSLSRSQPNLGAVAYAGYQYYALVGAVYNNASSNLTHIMHKQGDVWRLRSVNTDIASSATQPLITMGNPFSAVPKNIDAYFLCTSTDLNFAAGAMVRSTYFLEAATAYPVVIAHANATSVFLGQRTAQASIQGFNATSTATPSAIGTDKWDVFLTCEWWGV